MKVKDLLEEIESCKQKYDDFLEWDIYTEQLSEFDKAVKQGKETVKCINGVLDQSDWKWLRDSEGWEYCECAGYWTKFEKEKIFTVNVNF